MKKIEINSNDIHSADLVAGNIEQLNTLFPELITEGADGVVVNVDVLKGLVGDRTVTDVDEKYGLNWYGKRRARQLALTPTTGTLRPAPEVSLNWDSTQNLMLEGDNLEVLKLLQKSYSGKVKLIFIDPPYNTGKDFVYPDNYHDNIKNYLELTGQMQNGQKLSSNTEASGRFHTDWLNMIYPRLKLARNLLKDDGVMFMSIDDGEVANLRKVCDEIFGEENFIANIIWQKKYTRSNDAKWFSDNHDHILAYGKNKELVTLNGQERNEDQLKAYTNPDNHPKGPWKATPLHAKSGSNTKAFTFKNGVVWAPPKGTYRRFNDAAMQQMDEGNEIWFGEEGNLTPQRKSFLSEVKQGVTPVTLWPYQEVGHNHEANSDLKALGLGGIFDNPKPVRLLQRMIHLVTSTDEEHIVLDFFAGSGTTAHAVLESNAQDNGNRRFICVQLPHPLSIPVHDQELTLNTIADMTTERIRRAAVALRERYSNYKGDLGFRVYRLSNSNIRAWDPAPESLEQSLFDTAPHILEGRDAADVLTELLLKLGLELCVPVETKNIAGHKVFSVGEGVLIACLAPSITADDAEALAEGMVEWHRNLDPQSETTCVFLDDAFVDDITKVNVTAILEQSGIKNVRSL
ncbi:TPA: site-specific DNA-methyltransferase [Klebsiella pneumoniae]|uniref:site-specific DNA-methyltransferase n=1 Tax=Klebsiella pneumoniae TaxID=573 RepID=UPI00236ACC32|nr:site-specific DNA-methyltransferase [Klebsiella pneumoniae]MDE4825674.1 site-specific DNA-methyltransferase [Klebsiella pneumoniae]HDK7096369.1 site-specific DNA-methyltransferase [Klebsiella pneumoniae]HDZ1935905.1 site-specific DNA-methyltransferase [Klebsiella pneumoniae]